MLEFSIAADLALVDQATANVLEFASQQAKDVDRFRLALVLREALSNAIVHGANCDPSQRIDLRLTFDSEAMEFVLEVEDPGDGFDHETLTSIPDATATSGRGLAILSAYCCEVRHLKRGTHLYLRLKARRSGENA